MSLAFVFGIAWTASGLVPIFRQDWAGTPVKDMVAYPILLAVLWGTIAALARISGLSWEASGIGVGIAISLFSGRIGAVGAVSLFALSSWVVGDLVGRPFWPSDKGNHLGKALLGAGLWGTLLSVLASFPIHTPGLHATALVVPIIVRHRQIWIQVKGWKQELSSAPQFNRDGLLTGLIFSVALIHFLIAFFPELGYDALLSHLFVPGIVKANLCWSFDATKYAFAVQPMLGDWIFTINYLLAGEYAARIANVFFVFALAFLVRDLVIWAGGNSRGGQWAALLLLVTPLSLIESSSLFIECEWASYTLAGTLALARASSDSATAEKQWMLGGVWLGFALGTKLITGLAFPFLGCLVLIALLRSGAKRLIVPGLGGIAFMAIVGGIPYLRAWMETGNPTFPYFNEYFKSPLFPIGGYLKTVFNDSPGLGLISQITFDTRKFLETRPGAAGFQWTLLLFPAILSSFFLRGKKAILLFLGGIVTFLITFHFQSYLRYVFPSIAIVVSAIATAIFSYRPVGVFPEFVRMVGVWGLIGLNVFFLPVGSFYQGLPLLAAFSSEARKDLLFSRVRSMRLAIEAVNVLNTNREPIALFGPPYIAGVEADILHASWYNHEFLKAVETTQSAEAFGELLVERRVDFILFQNDWGTSQQRQWIEEITRPVVEYGVASVREVKPDVRFSRELLKNPTFSNPEGWVLGPNALFLGGNKGVRVNVSSPATQLVSVQENRRYKYHVEARCAEDPKAMGRLQINWADKNKNFLKANIDVFSCAQEGETYSMEFIAPERAAYATVYATGHGPEFLIFQRNSLR